MCTNSVTLCALCPLDKDLVDRTDKNMTWVHHSFRIIMCAKYEFTYHKVLEIIALFFLTFTTERYSPAKPFSVSHTFSQTNWLNAFGDKDLRLTLD